MERVQLIPGKGIGSRKEAEQRATSGLLAVSGLSIELLGRWAAPAASSGLMDVQCRGHGH